MVMLERLFRFAIQEGASDLFIVPGEPPLFRLAGELTWASGEHAFDEDTVEAVLQEIAPPPAWSRFGHEPSARFICEAAHVGRLRADYYRDARGMGAAFRPIPNHLPSLEELGLMPALAGLCEQPRGLILISGPPFSGKTTTLHGVINHINHHRAAHILSFEDPVEFLHHRARGLVHQRELGGDRGALVRYAREALYQDPDVLVFADLSGAEEIGCALEAAAAGPLVIATLSASTAAEAIAAVIDAWPAARRAEARRKLAAVLRGVVNQRLLRRKDGRGLVVAAELALATPPLTAAIARGAVSEDDLAAAEAGLGGSFNAALLRLIGLEAITPAVAFRASLDKDGLTDGFRRAGIALEASRFSNQQLHQVSVRRRVPIKLSREQELALLESTAGADTLAAQENDTLTVNLDASVSLGGLGQTLVPREEHTSTREIPLPGLDERLQVLEPAVLEVGKVHNATNRGRLLVQHPGGEESVIELFGGYGLLFGRSHLDLQRGLRNDWVCQAMPFDDPEARRATRRISRVHGGFRVGDDGGWQIANWSETGATIDGARLTKGRWQLLPSSPFELAIAERAVVLESRAFRAQALVLKRPPEEGLWYLLLRHRIDIGISRSRGINVYSALRGSQLGFGLVLQRDGFQLVPGISGHVYCNGRPLGSHRRLEPGLTVELGRYALTYQALTSRDTAR